MSVFAVEYVYGAEAAAARDEHRPAHREWLNGLVKQGNVLASGPFVDNAGALLLFVAESEADLNELLKQDPFATAGTISAVKTTQWNPVVGVLSEHADK
ncbi:hypothetical protein BJ994_001000 [Arthrobacter pigmenti]|uniref:YCII-related domain-containing protein n=1 Tax=Arthrobacter pigmenti TaxID=271432 RepID=A0A846RNK7_9MICC|nr:YciI family protein [Arthrobacter pigmenti]NJC21924.1 hypothetical protein [Arthrobacter pigmenti]